MYRGNDAITIKHLFNHSVLISKEGNCETLLNRAFPPLIESRVIEIESLVIYPS